MHCVMNLVKLSQLYLALNLGLTLSLSQAAPASPLAQNATHRTHAPAPSNSKKETFQSILTSEENPADIPYDSVPKDQTDLIIRRLRLVEKLITERGKAYDYRVLTNQDLERILATSESQESQ